MHALRCDTPTCRFTTCRCRGLPCPHPENKTRILASPAQTARFTSAGGVPKRDAPSCAIQRCTLTRTRQGKMFACEFLSPAAGTPGTLQLVSASFPYPHEGGKTPHSAPVPCLPRPRPGNKMPAPNSRAFTDGSRRPDVSQDRSVIPVDISLQFPTVYGKIEPKWDRSPQAAVSRTHFRNSPGVFPTSFLNCLQKCSALP